MPQKQASKSVETEKQTRFSKRYKIHTVQYLQYAFNLNSDTTVNKDIYVTTCWILVCTYLGFLNISYNLPSFLKQIKNRKQFQCSAFLNHSEDITMFYKSAKLNAIII